MQRLRDTVLRSLALLALVPCALAAQGAGTAQPDTTWLKWNPTTRTATFKLIAGVPGRAKSPFNFNGYTDGELVLTVPENSTVVLNFVNDDGTPHSAEVIADTNPMPNMAPDNPAIPRAYTKAVSEGIAQFGTDVVRFKASPVGVYRIFCGVPGHGLSGMWIRLAVSAEATAPTVTEASR
ncbi:MAG: sulfocyanin-like copper-binding protein [Gemmatimonadales bacterium]